MTKNILVSLFVFFSAYAVFAQTETVKAPNSEMVNGVKVYTAVDEQPQYPGGFAALTKFFNDSIVYPQAAIDEKIEGMVPVRFIVLEDGSITEVKIEKGLHTLLDQEALRVVSKFPKWTPAKVGGKAVASYVVIPISFTIPAAKLNHNTTRSNKEHTTRN